MIPDLDRAARAAADLARSFLPDPLAVLQSLPNVLVIAFSSSDGMLAGQDALTLVERKGEHLHYIVLYNSALPEYPLRRALARELGHIVLRHDGSSPEYIWSEEADCFAFHFLCPRPVIVIRYRPRHESLSMSFKDMRTFSSLDELRRAIADEYTRFSRFIGKNVCYTPEDVKISAPEEDLIAGWKNYSAVSVAGHTLGYCGE